MKNNKIYEAFLAKSDLLLNFQLCRTYLNDNCSVAQIVEKILVERYGDLSFKERAKIRECHGKSNATVEITRVDFKSTVNDILQSYVEKRFDKMVAEVLSGKGGYPIKFRDIIERFT